MEFAGDIPVRIYACDGSKGFGDEARVNLRAMFHCLSSVWRLQLCPGSSSLYFIRVFVEIPEDHKRCLKVPEESSETSPNFCVGAPWHLKKIAQMCNFVDHPRMLVMLWCSRLSCSRTEVCCLGCQCQDASLLGKWGV